MRTRGRIRPSKPASVLAMVVGVVFIGLGFFVFIPHAGGFGVFWTLIAICITTYHAVNVFSDGGVAQEIVEFDSPTSSMPTSRADSGETMEQRLASLDSLKQRGIVSETEYAEQRKRILNDL